MPSDCQEPSAAAEQLGTLFNLASGFKGPRHTCESLGAFCALYEALGEFMEWDEGNKVVAAGLQASSSH